MVLPLLAAPVDRHASEGEGQLVEVAEDDAHHGVGTKHLHRTERRDAAWRVLKGKI